VAGDHQARQNRSRQALHGFPYGPHLPDTDHSPDILHSRNNHYLPGSRFAAPEHAAEFAPGIAPNMNSTKKLAVLIVDDSTLIRQRVRSMISQLDCVDNIVEAGSVPEALEYLRTFRPDVAVLDLRLGFGNGLDVLRVIKLDLPACTNIILSNMPVTDIREVCLESGADFCFNKALEFERVLQVIASAATEPA
jgi:CheY-like chemotaxis protein